MRPYHVASDCVFYVGDCRAVLACLPERSVGIVVCSPPYWGLRKYEGVEPSIWGGDPTCDHGESVAIAGARPMPSQHLAAIDGRRSEVCARCGAWRGLLGLEPLHDGLCWARGENCGRCYVCHIRTVFAAVHRVLRDDGTLWINLGDSYAGSGKGPSESLSRHNGQSVGLANRLETRQRERTENHTEKYRAPSGLKTKDRVGIPQRVALALQADGYYWRDCITLCKTAPMPESVRDRTTQATEVLLLFSKRERYYYDAEAVREKSDPEQEEHNRRYAKAYDLRLSQEGNGQPGKTNHVGIHQRPGPSGRNARNWLIWRPEPSDVQHFATYPRWLPRFAIRAGCPPGGVVLDPFSGSATTQVVARELGRRSIYVDASEHYATTIAIPRYEGTTPALPLVAAEAAPQPTQLGWEDAE